MFKKSDPLLIGVEAAVEHDELGDGHATNVLFHTFASANEANVLVGDLRGEGHLGGGLDQIFHVLSEEGTTAEAQLNVDIFFAEVRHLWLQLEVHDRDVHMVRCKHATRSVPKSYKMIKFH